MEKAAEHQEPSSKHQAAFVTPDEVDKEHELHEHDDVLALVQQVTPATPYAVPPPFEAQFSKQEGAWFDDVPQWDSDPSRLWVRPWFQTLSVLPNGQGEYYGRFFANPVENIISFPRSTFMDLHLGNDIGPLNEFNDSFRNKLMHGNDSEFDIVRLGAAGTHMIAAEFVIVHPESWEEHLTHSGQSHKQHMSFPDSVSDPTAFAFNKPIRIACNPDWSVHENIFHASRSNLFQNALLTTAHRLDTIHGCQGKWLYATTSHLSDKWVNRFLVSCWGW
jgi:hypothetical protein